MTDGNIDFRDTLLSFRNKLTSIEQWWYQGDKEKAKQNMLELAERLEGAAEYHFRDVDCIEDYFGELSEKEEELGVPEEAIKEEYRGMSAAEIIEMNRVKRSKTE